MIANKRNKSEFILIFLILIVVYINSNHTILSDDTFFANVLSKTNIIDYTSDRYNHWSGRYLLEALMVEFIRFEFITKILIISSVVIMGYSIAIISQSKKSFRISLALFVSFLLMLDINTYSQSVFWFSGAYNYVIPISLGIFALSLYKINIKTTKFRIILISALLFFSCNNEQFGAVTLLFLAMIVCYKIGTSTLKKIDLLYFFIVLVSFLSNILAPGNKIRFNIESSKFPEYYSYGLFDKISLGMDKLNAHILSGHNYLVLALAIIILCHIIKENKTNITSVITTITCGIYITFVLSEHYNLFSFTNTISLTNGYLSGGTANPVTWREHTLYISYLFTMIFLSSIYCYLLSTIEEKKKFYLGAAISLCSISSAIMIGFSPTVYSSGTRVMFIFDITLLIVLILAMSFKRFEHED